MDKELGVLVTGVDDVRIWSSDNAKENFLPANVAEQLCTVQHSAGAIMLNRLEVRLVMVTCRCHESLQYLHYALTTHKPT